MAENDKVFNDLLTGVTDLSANLRFDNNKGITGEIAAGATYKNLLKLDASNIAQLGEAGTEVRVPADPTNALGVATKQYVDNTLMKGLVAKVYATTTSATNSDVVNISAVGRLIHLRVLNAQVNNGRCTLTLDSIADPEKTITNADRWYDLDRTLAATDTFLLATATVDVAVHFKTSLRVQHRDVGGGGQNTTVIYERN